jgi:hypothetical protein
MAPFKKLFSKSQKSKGTPSKLGGSGSKSPAFKPGAAPTKGFAYKPESVDMKDVSGMLKETYNEKAGDVGDYRLDSDLSNKRVKVYHDPVSNKLVVAHRGSSNLQDWKENAQMMVGIRSGKGFKKSKETQKKAEEKYAGAHLTTIGHSKGATHAEMFGKKGEVVTLNKPVTPGDILHGKKVGKHQTDYKSSRDPVSILRGYQKGSKAKVIKSKTFNPLTEHGVPVLDRMFRE